MGEEKKNSPTLRAAVNYDMTPREKHLRTALSNAKYKFNEIDVTVSDDHSELAEQGMEDAEKAMQEADMMPDGPSDDDKMWLANLSKTNYMKRKKFLGIGYSEGSSAYSIDDLVRLISELLKSWGMKR